MRRLIASLAVLTALSAPALPAGAQETNAAPMTSPLPSLTPADLDFKETERGLVVELNPGDAALPLRPTGQGASARLRVTYFVNEDRWLCTTVYDLVRKQPLRENEPVVRLR